MNLSAHLDTKIAAARAYLDSVHEGGAFFDPLPLDPSAAATCSMAATGAAAHLYAWLFSISGSDTDRRASRASADVIVAWLSDGSFRAQRFWDLGAAARGMYAASKAFARPDYWDASIALGAAMARCSETDDSGPHQRKPATIYRLLKRVSDYDDLDYEYFGVDLTTLIAASKPAVAADLTFCLASSAEALLMGDASQDRGRREFESLRRLVKAPGELRADVLALALRLHLVQGHSLVMGDLDRLFDFQHQCGGFHERITSKGLSSRLSPSATMIAIQTMAMAQNGDRCRLPGPLTRKELALV